MLVAKSNHFGCVYAGPEIQRLNAKKHDRVLTQGFTCPSCGDIVRYTDASPNHPFKYFQHADQSSDCFQTKAVSDNHRIATEITLKALHNRIKTATGEQVDIDVERWIGIRENFIIADIRVTSPLQVAAEVYYKADRLALGRKLDTMFENNYRTYLVFHRDGCHDIDRVEQYIRRIAPLDIGRFDPQTLEVALGDLFSEQHTDLSSTIRNQVPDYIAR